MSQPQYTHESEEEINAEFLKQAKEEKNEFKQRITKTIIYFFFKFILIINLPQFHPRTETLMAAATISSPFLNFNQTLIPKPKPFLYRAKRPIFSLTPKASLSFSALALVLGVGVGLPCTVMECGDIICRSTLPISNALNITAPGVALALAAVSFSWATPGVAPGFFDMFVLAFIDLV